MKQPEASNLWRAVWTSWTEAGQDGDGFPLILVPGCPRKASVRPLFDAAQLLSPRDRHDVTQSLSEKEKLASSREAAHLSRVGVC